jgi:A/G-specific adenine glycosylase
MSMDIDSHWSRPELAALRRHLMRWYSRSARNLPWRSSGDPYRVWLSEIMLQQTTVAAVIPYYERFLRRFPTVQSLADADVQAVLTAWEGLGYYSRARNLHRTATIVTHQFGGRFPDSVEGLLTLPGIGRYTAGAIVSFAFNRPAPIVEANTLRLFARLIGYEGDPRSAAGQAVLWQFAESILPRTDASDFNQALMDLGATVCTVSEPNCSACPLHSMCRAFSNGRQREIPLRRSRPEPTTLYEFAFAIRSGDRWLVRQRTATERWGGLWDFPRIETDEATWSERVSATRLQSCLNRISEIEGVRAKDPVEIPDSSYGFTRYRVRLRRIVACLDKICSHAVPGRSFVCEKQLVRLPLTRSARQFVDDLFETRNAWEPDDRPFQLSNRPRRRVPARRSGR